MSPTIRNIIIYVAIGAALVLIYIFFIKPSTDQGNLVVSVSSATLPNVNGSATNTAAAGTTPFVASDFLNLLLNVKTIKLDDSIFSDPAFISLHDSSIVLIPDTTEGRPNPFAQFGNDAGSAPSSSPNNISIAPGTPTIPVNPTTPTSPVTPVVPGAPGIPTGAPTSTKPPTIPVAPITPVKPTTPAAIVPTKPTTPTTPTTPASPPAVVAP